MRVRNGLYWEDHRKHGPVLDCVHTTPNRELPFVPFHDVLADPQTQSCSAETFCGEKRLEGVFRVRGVIPVPVSATVILSPCRPDLQSVTSAVCRISLPPLPSHRRRYRSVVQHLTYLTFKTEQRSFCIKTQFGLDACITNSSLVDHEGVLKQLFAPHLPCSGLLPMKPQRLTCNRRHTSKLDLSSIQIAKDLLAVRASLREVKKVRHRFERVVDLVSNRAGKLSDCGELFALPKRCLCISTFRHVDVDAGNLGDNS